MMNKRKKSTEAEKDHQATAPTQRITLEDTTQFEREGFTGHEYVSAEVARGFSALSVEVHGRHPRKRIETGTTRTYYVIDGTGTFMLGDTTHDVSKGDLFIIPAGSEYEYKGNMDLFEVNVSPDNSFRDQVVE